MKELEVTDYNREALENAKQATAERMGYPSWAEMKEQNEFDYNIFSSFWEQVAIHLSYQLTDHKEALKLWDPVNSFVQENADDLKVKIGSSIAKSVLDIVKKWHLITTIWN
jgi:hypothetical protein